MVEFEKVAAQIIQERAEVMEACRETLTSLLDTSAVTGKIEKAARESERITTQVKSLIGEQSRGVVEGFAEKYAALEKKYDVVQESINHLEAEKSDQEYRARQALVFLETLDGAKLGDSGLFVALVDRVIVGQGLKFILRDESEWAAG